MSLLDALGRPLRNLRLSVTDRCNLRCEYCMPEEDYVWLPREDLLHFEEISTLVDVFLALGVDRAARSPAASRCCAATSPRWSACWLAEAWTCRSGHDDQRHPARRSDRKPPGRRPRPRHGEPRYAAARSVRRARSFRRARRACKKASPRLTASSAGLKIDTVVIRGVNDDELVDLIEYGRTVNAEVRFIEYMDVGGATHWSPGRVVSRVEILESSRRAQYGTDRTDCRTRAPRQPIVSRCPTARRSASSPRRRSRSARAATAAG